MTQQIVSEVAHQFAAGEQVPSRVLNRAQEDSVILSDELTQLHLSRWLPKIHTADYKMSVVASADTVTLTAGITFDVGGVMLSTDDLPSRAATIPDNSTKYLYLEVGSDCGDVVDWTASPIERQLTATMTLDDAKTDSTPTKMLVLKAVKASSGETPTVTLYANSGAPLTGAGGAANYWYNTLKGVNPGTAYVGATDPEQVAAYSSGGDQYARLTLPIDDDRIALLPAGKKLVLELYCGRGALTSGTEVKLDLTARLDDPGGADTITKSVTLDVSAWTAGDLAWREVGIELTESDYGASAGVISGRLTRNDAAADETDADFYSQMDRWVVKDVS